MEAGEDVTITVAGRPVALRRPLGVRQRWIPTAEFLARLRQADSALSAELRELADDTTDDLIAVPGLAVVRV